MTDSKRKHLFSMMKSQTRLNNSPTSCIAISTSVSNSTISDITGNSTNNMTKAIMIQNTKQMIHHL